MEKKNLIEFIGLFDSLHSAASLIYDKNHPNNEVIHDKFLNTISNKLHKSRIASVNKAFVKIFSQPPPERPGLPFHLINEIEENLFSYSEDRIIYIKNILRQFYQIAPYLYSNLITDPENLEPIQKESTHLINEIIEENIKFEDSKVPEKYIFWCWLILSEFFLHFDALCLNFKIDIMEIQKEMNIYVYPEREIDVLNGMGYKATLRKISNNQKEIIDLGDQKIENKTEIPTKLISFDSPETIEKLSDRLKGYFPCKESEIERALKGEKLQDPLVFPHDQIKFVEVFRRLKYNGLLPEPYTKIRDWLCLNFKQKNGNLFNQDTVYDALKGKIDLIQSKRRILNNLDWLPYKRKDQLKEEEENEEINDKIK